MHKLAKETLGKPNPANSVEKKKVPIVLTSFLACRKST